MIQQCDYTLLSSPSPSHRKEETCPYWYWIPNLWPIKIIKLFLFSRSQSRARCKHHSHFRRVFRDGKIRSTRSSQLWRWVCLFCAWNSLQLSSMAITFKLEIVFLTHVHTHFDTCDSISLKSWRVCVRGEVTCEFVFFLIFLSTQVVGFCFEKVIAHLSVLPPLHFGSHSRHTLRFKILMSL